jgi:glycosyltransferase involved in cell wall biosynthesis
MKLSIVIPVYNEKDTLEEIFRLVELTPYVKEIIAVDDASTDGSRDILRRLAEEYEDVRVIYHDRNQGKGAALRTGFAQVTGDVVVIQDADLEYRPDDYPALLEPIQQNVADVVYGSRMVGGRPHRVLFFWHYMGNRCVTTLSNIFTNLNLSDMEVGYKVAKGGWRIYEVPIQYHGRDYAHGKKITWRDGLAAIYHIIRFRYWD